MELPKCQNANCLSQAHSYLPTSKLYLCSTHKATTVSDQEIIVLVNPTSVIQLVRSVELYVGGLACSVGKGGDLSVEEDEEWVEIGEKMKEVRCRVEDFLKRKEYFRVGELLKEGFEVKEMAESKWKIMIESGSQDRCKEVKAGMGQNCVSCDMDVKYLGEDTKMIEENSGQNAPLLQENKKKFSNCKKKHEESKRDIQSTKSLKKSTDLIEQNENFKYFRKVQDFMMIVMIILLCCSAFKIHDISTSSFTQETHLQLNSIIKDIQIISLKADLIDLKLHYLKETGESNTNLLKQKEALAAEIEIVDGSIRELEEESYRDGRDFRKVKEELKRVKEQMVMEVEVYTKEEFNKLSKEVIGEAVWSEGEVVLELRDSKHLEFLRSINKRIPNLNELHIDYIPSNNEDIKIFLKYYFPEEVKEFYLNSGSELSSRLDYYISEILLICPKVKTYMLLYHFEVSQQNLLTLLPHSKHMNRFGFAYCNLEISSVPDFGSTLDGNKIKTLYLYYSRQDFFIANNNKPSGFENLMEGLSNSEDFKKNLGRIWVTDSGVSENLLKDLVHKHGFKTTEIWV
ncbi:unnamed protein product [Moneuplotes crassus]|uniref:Uncharacterized protein n=1 Tax=Euplotes crassus TaxID=5936 RepID=A0AAD1U2N3_EUPCR|nr:unnamed protein product [Moneuplotes crassus]